MFKPQGVYVAMMTPFKMDGSLNEKELRRIVDFQIKGGVHGLFPVSTVGEYIHLSFDEKVRMMEITVDQAAGRVPVTPGAAGSHPDESICLARKAAELECEAVVIAPPHYFPHSQESINKHYETIINAIDIPVIIYNIPLFTQPLSYDVVGRLARYESVIGLKDSGGSMVDMMHYMDEFSSAGKDLNVLTGREETMFALLMAGGKGCMTTTAGIFPEVMSGIYTDWENQDFEKALKKQRSILKLIRAMFVGPFPMGFKYAMKLRGFDMGPPKIPFSDDQKEEFKRNQTNIDINMQHLFKDLNNL